MRLPDENKRRQILSAAGKLFSDKSFHEVLLDEVAAEAKVGKGTLYIYFKSKEDLYSSLVLEGFSGIIEQLKQLNDGQLSFREKMHNLVSSLIDFAYRHPHMFELVRQPAGPTRMADWQKRRIELSSLIESILQKGIDAGECIDAHPNLTANLIPGLVRSAMMFGPKDISPQVVIQQISQLVLDGLTRKASA
jgi:TetR/AcrR family fatty acid metabolism transcriptional regulator